MAYDDIVKGAASNSKIIEVAVRDSTTGQLKASIAYGSVTYSYIREGTDSTKATGTCVDMTLDTYTDHGWKETGIAGIYQFCVPDAALATGKNAVTIKLTSTGAIDVVKRILITGSDLRAAYLSANAAQINGVATTSVTTIGACIGSAYTLAVDAANCVKVPDTQKVDVNTVKTQTVTCAAGVTVNTNVGTTQPVNFTGTAGTAYVKTDLVDIAGAAVSATTAQLGVNVVNVAGTVQTAGDIIGRIGTPANIDSGGATLADNLKKIVDDNGGASFDATVSSLNKLSTAVVTGVASTLQATANVETTGTLISGTYASTYLSNGTSWVTAPVTPAVAEASSTLSPFGLNANLLFTAGASQTINSVSIRGNFAAVAGRYCNVYAYDYITRSWDMLSDVGTRMNTTVTLTSYAYTLLSVHQKATAAVATTSNGSNFVGVTTTCTASVNGHGFVTGDIVTISGITTLTNANGTFMVTRTNDNVFTYGIVSQSATGGGTAAMTTDALNVIRVGFKSPSTTTGDRLNVDLCLVNVATAGPSTADIADAVYAKLATSVYGRQVWIDTVSGVDGYEIGVNGLDHTPVLTIACAYQLCDDLGLKTIAFKSGSNAVAVTLTRSAAGWRFYGPGKIDLGGQSIADAIFEECYSVYGTSTGDDASFYRCQIGSGGLTLDHSYVTACRIKGAITLIANAEPIIFQDCIDATGAGADFELIFVANATAVIRNFQGGITLKSMAATNSLIIDGALRVTIDASCTAGSITMRGFAPPLDGAAAFVSAGGTITQTQRYGTDQAGADTSGVTTLLTRTPNAAAGATGGLAIVGSVMGKSPATLAPADVSGNLPANVLQWNTGALPTIGTSTLVASDILAGDASKIIMASGKVSVPDTQKVDVNTIKTATVAATSTVTFANGTVSTFAAGGNVNLDTIKTQAITCAAGVTINTNVGTTQPLNFTGTAGSALVKTDMVDVAGAAVSATTAQLGVNVVNIAGTASAGQAGYVAPDWGHVYDKTATVGLTNTTVGTASTVTGAITLPTIPNDWITAAGIAAGAIDNATFAADVGSTAYATNIVALAVDKALDAYNTTGVAKEASAAAIKAETVLIYADTTEALTRLPNADPGAAGGVTIVPPFTF